MRTEGLRGFEQENVALAERQTVKTAFQRWRQFTATQLQCCRSRIEGADQFGIVCHGDTIVEGDQAVGFDALGHADFPVSCVNCCHRIKTTPTLMAESATLNAGQ